MELYNNLPDVLRRNHKCNHEYTSYALTVLKDSGKGVHDGAESSRKLLDVLTQLNQIVTRDSNSISLLDLSVRLTDVFLNVRTNHDRDISRQFITRVRLDIYVIAIVLTVNLKERLSTTGTVVAVRVAVRMLLKVLLSRLHERLGLLGLNLLSSPLTGRRSLLSSGRLSRFLSALLLIKLSLKPFLLKDLIRRLVSLKGINKTLTEIQGRKPLVVLGISNDLKVRERRIVLLIGVLGVVSVNESNLITLLHALGKQLKASLKRCTLILSTDKALTRKGRDVLCHGNTFRVDNRKLEFPLSTQLHQVPKSTTHVGEHRHDDMNLSLLHRTEDPLSHGLLKMLHGNVAGTCNHDGQVLIELAGHSVPPWRFVLLRL